MSLRLYMDEQVQSAITQGLRARGIDVMTAHGASRLRSGSRRRACIDELALIAQLGEPEDLSSRLQYLPLR